MRSSSLLPHIHPSSFILDWLVNSTCPVVSVSPVMAFHTRIVPSKQPETMCWPFGENATDMTESGCPLKGPATVSPVVAFHIRIVPSEEPETMSWPSGENATDPTEPECPLNGPATVSP